MAQTDWPETDNYFGFYGLKPVYDLDSAVLKQLFLEKSRQFHPDFFGDDMEAQSKAIEITAYNNKAYRTLSQPMERVRYLIRMNGAEGEENGKLPQDFLMEMLELNEQIDELAFSEHNEENKLKVQSEIDAALKALSALLINLVNAKQWEAAKDELLKVNYLERLLARLPNGNE